MGGFKKSLKFSIDLFIRFRITMLVLCVTFVAGWSTAACQINLVNPSSGLTGDTLAVSVQGVGFAFVGFSGSGGPNSGFSVSFGPGIQVTVTNMLPAAVVEMPEEIMVSLAIDLAATPGPRTVTVTSLENGQSCSQDGFTVGVTDTSQNEPPVARVNLISPQALLGKPFTFDATPSFDSDGQITQYQWNFGDGSGASAAVAAHTYNAPGSYTVTLTVTDNEGAQATVQFAIHVVKREDNKLPIASFSLFPAPPAKIFVGDQVLFNATSSHDPDGSIISYSWDFGDGQGGGGPSQTLHTYTKSGTYTVTLTVADDDEATAVARLLIRVEEKSDNKPPVADFSIQPRLVKDRHVIPANTYITFDASKSHDGDGSISFYQWDIDGLSAQGKIVSRVVFTKKGKYQVTLTVVDNDGASSSVSDYVVVRGKADVSVSIDAFPNILEVGDNATFVVTVKNNGPDIANGAVVKVKGGNGDRIPAQFIKFSSIAPGCRHTGGTSGAKIELYCRIGSLEAGAESHINLTTSQFGRDSFFCTNATVATESIDTNITNDFTHSVCKNVEGRLDLTHEDSDGDGIADGIDKCPNQAGVLSNNGCPPKESSVKKTAHVASHVLNATAATSATVAVGVGAYTGGSAVAAEVGFGLLSGVTWLASEVASVIAEDPPDPNYRTIFQPLSLAIPSVDDPQIAPLLSTAFNALTTNQAQQISLAQALLVSLERAQGAFKSDDFSWQAKQTEAAANYASQLASLFRELPTLNENLVEQWEAAGLPDGAVTTDQFKQFQTDVLQNGLPSSVVDVIDQLGSDRFTPETLTSYIISQDPKTITTSDSFLQSLTDDNLVNLINQSARGFQSFADSTHDLLTKVSNDQKLSVEQALDTNHNNALDDGEIRTAIQLWISGQVVPGTDQTIDDAKIRQLIQLWISGESVTAQAQALVAPAMLSLDRVSIASERGQFTLNVTGQGIRKTNVQVFDLAGRRVLERTSESSPLRFEAVDTAGRRWSNGVYLYVVTVYGDHGSALRSELHKFVVLR